MTEIFDQENGLAVTKTHAFEISTAVAKDQAAQATALPADIYAANFGASFKKDEVLQPAY